MPTGVAESVSPSCDSSRLEAGLAKLERWFGSLSGSLTAFSGGVDSALVLYLSDRYLGKRGVGVIADSPSLKRSDRSLADAFCKERGIVLETIYPNELENASYASNPPNRCFYCKDALYKHLRSLQESRYSGYAILNGSNQDDLSDYRPGLKAASEWRIRSPLAECGIGKSEARALAKRFGLSVWDKPASPCLSSRIPYGDPVTRSKLNRIEQAEAILGDLGMVEARVRHYEDFARVEVPSAWIDRARRDWTLVERSFQKIGFSRVELDEEGLVSGKLNRALNIDERI